MAIEKASFDIHYDEIVIIEVEIHDEGVHNALVRYVARKIDPGTPHTPIRNWYYEVARTYFDDATENIDDAPDVTKPIIEAIRLDQMFEIASTIALVYVGIRR
jgi:hypothetical protein